MYFFDDHTYPVTTAYVILPSRSPVLTLPTVPVPITLAARQIKGLKRFYKVAEVVPSSDTDGVRALIRAVVSLAGLHPWAVLVAGEWRVMCDSHYASLSPCCNTLVSPRFYELSNTPVLRCDAGRKDAENAGAKQLQCTFANQNTADKATCATSTSVRCDKWVCVSRAAKGIVKWCFAACIVIVQSRGKGRVSGNESPHERWSCVKSHGNTTL